MKSVLILIFILGWVAPNKAQVYKSTESETTFFSSAPVEDIKASNTKATSIFNAGTGAAAFRIPINAFEFRKSLMKQHFNENFMESDKYPHATFEGKITGYDREVSSSQEAVAEGDMTIHGVTQKVYIKGNMKFSQDRLTMDAKFPVRLEDYKISIPRVLFMNIAEEVEVTVRYVFEETN